jgi:hypothetical protein
MSTRQTFYAETPEQAEKLAEEYLATLDEAEQAHVSAAGINWEGKYYATVTSYGLD